MLHKWILMEADLDEIKNTSFFVSFFGKANKINWVRFLYLLVGWFSIYCTCVLFWFLDAVYTAADALQSVDCNGTEAGCGLAFLIGIFLSTIAGAIVWGLVLAVFLVGWRIARCFRIRGWILYLLTAICFGLAFYRFAYDPDTTAALIFGVGVSLYMLGWGASYKYIHRVFSRI